MGRPAKRRHAESPGTPSSSVVIDLTSDDDGNRHKYPRLSASQESARVLSSSFSSSPATSRSVYSSSQSSSKPSTSSYQGKSSGVFSSPVSKHSPLKPSTSSNQGPSSSQFLEPENLTQGDSPLQELYGILENKIVGIRYYNGVVSPGEFAICRREPDNQYDKFAIRIDNVLGCQIGHLPRKVVEKLSPYVDSDDIALEVQISGEKGFYDCPVKIFIFGSSDPRTRAQLEMHLKGDKLLNATQLRQTKQEAELRRASLNLTGSQTPGLGRPGQKASQPSMEDLVKKSQVVEVRTAEDIVKSLAWGEETLSKMPLASQPKQLKFQLLPYQLQGLAWLVKKEHPELPTPGAPDYVQLWKRDVKGRYLNVATNFVTTVAPDLLSGGILADDMGLGKTLQLISLILTGGPGNTLIVAPMSVMSNWQQQIERHVHEAYRPRVLIHHGPKRARDAKEMAKFDVVITTYNTMALDFYPGSSGPFHKLEWRRVVLDEGHTIRNSRTFVAEAAYSLKAKSRWVLSGTPIVNNLRDLHSLLKFLRIKGGIEDSDIFRAVIERGLAYGDSRAENLLRSLMSDICLRRLKTMKMVDLKLPPKTEYVHHLTFTSEEQKKYDGLLSDARGVLNEMRDNKKAKDGSKLGFQSVLEKVLRLRQMCCHWALCKEQVESLFSKEGPASHLLDSGSEGEDDAEIFADSTMKGSSKTNALVKILQATLKNPGSKVVVFSQWTSFLSVIQGQMERAGLKFTRIDGTMKPADRDAAIQALEEDPDTRVMLASLGVCSVGLNLVAADTVILADSWWAPAIEDQAIDRVNRLGQTRPTTIWRLVMENTLEERVLDVQAEKRELVGKAFQEKSKESKAKETRMADLMKLLA